MRIKAPTGAMERTGVIFEVNDAWGVVGAMCVVVTGQNEAPGALKFPSMGLICRGAFKAAFGGVHSPEPLNAVHGRVHRANAAFVRTMRTGPILLILHLGLASIAFKASSHARRRRGWS